MAYVDTCQIFTSAQVESLRKGGAILKDCLKHVAALVKPGMTTMDLDKEAEKFIRARGGTPAFKGYHGFSGTLCTSVNDRVVHGIPSAKEKLKEGDIISLDCGVIYDELYTDACISVGVGKISDEAQLFLSRSSEILEAVIREKVKAGARVGDISSFIQQGLEKHGYSAVKVLTGHGLGDNLHQFPDVPNVGKASTGPVLPANTMIAIEPIAVMGSPDVFTATDQWTVLTKDSSLACHFEHSVLVLDGGCEIVA